MTGPLEQLRALAAGDGLTEHYPRVRGLLGPLSTVDLERAGMLLSRLDPDRVRAAHPGLPVVRVAITGHGTVASILPALTAEAARHGVLLAPEVSAFDGYAFDLADPGSDLYAHRPELILCLLDPMVVIDELPTPWTAADAARTIEAKIDLVAGLARAHAARHSATLALTTLPLPATLLAQLVDHRSRAELSAAWRRANARLLDLAAELPALVVVDVDPLLAEGIPAIDERMSHYAKAHLSPALLTRLAREFGHLARQLTGSGGKCLAVDLDNTLWGGILGDDGIEGIQVGEGPAGEAYAAFQRVLKQLSSQGVLLAAVSKNDLEPVRAALSGHPGMVLREQDFVRIAANWRPKPENLAELAADLNLATDALVFVDDSPFECGSVRHELPGVAVVELDHEPARHAARLLADGWFTVRELTATDRARPALYREELARQSFLGSAPTLADYLTGLGIRVDLSAVTPADIPRISQITLRTNQFNLTTRRMQPAEVELWLAEEGCSALAIRSADRFGDNGLVGAVLRRREGDTLRIENFLLSCRVFSRGIEDACLAAVLRHAAATGARAVTGSYRPTAKNGKVADFYPRHGFTAMGQGEFRHDLGALPPHPEHIQLTGDLTEAQP
ncbi:HAD-IIIC family phosphatase [Crossiella sp. SN42]|uniref:HAD-IIIC family phosphatase n=1 Tax=Crossiella sp. SN42 TaxID=2944808 RepID=UPI00207C7B9A|nr:HAD-IIIC family phosphatase [Crossiella sp. SN42]MCO1582766.1 HAD-IIIC family phosphatase [Crossiella sp. SN42]